MILVRRVGPATFESPDVERLTDYYRQVLGLALVAWNAGAIHLARTLDNQSVVLRHGP